MCVRGTLIIIFCTHLFVKTVRILCMFFFSSSSSTTISSSSSSVDLQIHYFFILIFFFEKKFQICCRYRCECSNSVCVCDCTTIKSDQIFSPDLYLWLWYVSVLWSHSWWLVILVDKLSRSNWFSFHADLINKLYRSTPSPFRARCFHFSCDFFFSLSLSVVVCVCVFFVFRSKFQCFLKVK